MGKPNNSGKDGVKCLQKMCLFQVGSHYLNTDSMVRVVHWGEWLKKGQHDWIRVLSAADQHPDFHLPLKSCSPKGVINEWPVSVQWNNPKAGHEAHKKGYLGGNRQVSFVVQIHLLGFPKRVVGKYSITAILTKCWASEMLERIASKSWVLDWGQNEGGDPWWEMELWTEPKQQNCYTIHTLYSDFWW